MQLFTALFLAVILLSNPVPSSQRHSTGAESLPSDFSSRAFKHIVHLAGMGHRQAGTENDRLTVRYVKEQFEDMNIAVEIQPFEFKSFEFSCLSFQVGHKGYDVVGIGFNPYKNKRVYEGTALLIDLKDPEIRYTREKIEGKTIIANDWNGHFRLLQFKPELIIYVDSRSFKELKSLGKLPIKLNIEGVYKKYRSANIVGRIGENKASSKNILITAHFDTYKRNNPGASDNASGLGVLLELARWFKKRESDLNCSMKFVAFGAEEMGIIGSRNYLYTNTESLQHCELLFNIDDVGGNGPVTVEMAGAVNGISERKCVSQIPEFLKDHSWEGVISQWRMLADDDLMKIMTASNHPQWLVDVVNKSIKELGYDIEPTGTQGSDQLAFAQAGIVTSGVGIVSELRHSSKDIPEKIDKRSLKIAGEIAASVVLNTLKRFRESH
ncbi:MAG: M20/M25/M40 family metallo-hydrolase [Chitinivibrionales bacterium]|nr:M20/M25/M40 family metallo-hydrolase [Chitinivibrionales bacterium]